MTYNVDAICQWMDHDPDEHTREELNTLLQAAEGGDENAVRELESAFSGPLTFGTAGLRGKMGPGETRMNRAVVRRAAAGLVEYLRDVAGDDALLVVGFDARHHSAEFAADTCAIAAAAGIRARIMPRALPTPLLAYAVRSLGADAGVMVTASHNPAQDNGYKVYLGGRCAEESGRGVQLVPPADADIAARINAAPPADEIPLADSYERIDPSIVDEYIEEAASLMPDGYASDLKIVYTAMHGVGAQIMRPLFVKAGFTNVIEVAEQCDPDPDFPTVSFPNPEEEGALDMAIDVALAEHADIVIASDPDADRCSAAVRDGKGWRQLTGDEIGVILGNHIASRAALGSKDATMASSIVSSRLLEEVATAHGLAYEATLTGFKWIARTKGLVYGYEEAIGFCVNPSAVRDKDGMSAAILLARVADDEYMKGNTLLDALDRLYTKYGVYLSAPVTLRVDDLEVIPATMDRVRKNPPADLAQSPVAETIDLAVQAEEFGLPPSDVVLWYTEQNDRVVVRPSGTEPKVKCYVEVYSPVPSSGDLEEAKTVAARRMERLKADVATALGM